MPTPDAWCTFSRGPERVPRAPKQGGERDEADSLPVVTYNGANSNKPGLFQCELDGSACTHTDISSGQAAGSGLDPVVAIDAPNRRLLAVTDNAATSNKPALFTVCLP